MNPNSSPVPGVLPHHVAIVMDGNNRWARQRGLRSQDGHSRGSEVARTIVSACAKLKIPYLTLFAFSSENWLRPQTEVRSLMALFLTVLRRDELAQLQAEGIRIRFIGNRLSFSPTLQRGMAEVERKTAGNTVCTVFVAMDYGGRWDVAQATAKLVASLPAGSDLGAAITPDAIASHLSLAGIADPDLCIRTGGEKRLSNFLLWQFAYTELYFCDTYWPDFTDADLLMALEDYAQRERRFGGKDAEPAEAGRDAAPTEATGVMRA